MITLKTGKPDITLNIDGSVNLTFKSSKGAIKDFDKIRTDELLLEIKEYHEKRTLTQNSYLWKLLNLLAVKLGNTSENIYREFIRDYGVREYILIQDKAVKKFSQMWENKGIGWFSEVLRKGKVEDTTTLIMYYGSSTYNSKDMARLIDAVVESCVENDIPTLSNDEVKHLLNEND